MCIKRLFCINHKLKLVAYKEALTDDGEVLSRTAIYKCEKCEKIYKKMQIHARES